MIRFAHPKIFSNADPYMNAQRLVDLMHGKTSSGVAIGSLIRLPEQLKASTVPGSVVLRGRAGRD
jgi:hypothetical protein